RCRPFSARASTRRPRWRTGKRSSSMPCCARSRRATDKEQAMADVGATAKSGKVVIRNVGLMLSGDIDKPILDADTIVVTDGVIAAVGREKDCDIGNPRTEIDCKKTCVAPGLIDSHVHPVFGDWTPRQSQLNWIDSTMNG